MSKRYAIVAGGSGGHIIPGIMYGNQLRKHDDELILFSTKNQLDAAIVEQFPFVGSYEQISLLPVPGKKFWRYPAFFFHLLKGIFESYHALKKYAPERVVSMGGLVSVPVCLAAWLRGIPVTLFELNAAPGKAVRWLAPLADQIHVCFASAGKGFDPAKVFLKEYPLRFTEKMRTEKARADLNIPSNKKVILILGGSQGSRALNKLIGNLVSKDSSFFSDIVVLHQTGTSMIGGQSSARLYADLYEKAGVAAQCVPFVPDLAPYYAAADVVISRAGAGTVFELAYFKKKALLMPLEYSAEGHQLENTLAMMQRYPDLFSLVRQPHCEENSAVLHKALLRVLEKTIGI